MIFILINLSKLMINNNKFSMNFIFNDKICEEMNKKIFDIKCVIHKINMKLYIKINDNKIDGNIKFKC